MLHAITALRLTTADPDRLAAFYEALGFTRGERHPIPADELDALGLGALPAGSTRTPLTLGGPGGQRLELDHFAGPLRPYPPDATGADSVSRHPALVTADAAAAWRRALGAGARAVSRAGPVTLPASSGGVTAAKFRDPEGHPLEFLQFPPGSAGARKWGTGPAPGTGGGGGAAVLGIDHLAMAVLDTTAAEVFFSGLGLAVQAPGLNHGPTQAALDGLDDPRVAVVPIKVGGSDDGGAPGANLELLGYQAPRGRDLGPVAPTDIASLRTAWAADRDALLRDPSGHLHWLRRT